MDAHAHATVHKHNWHSCGYPNACSHKHSQTHTQPTQQHNRTLTPADTDTHSTRPTCIDVQIIVYMYARRQAWCINRTCTHTHKCKNTHSSNHRTHTSTPEHKHANATPRYTQTNRHTHMCTSIRHLKHEQQPDLAHELATHWESSIQKSCNCLHCNKLSAVMVHHILALADECFQCSLQVLWLERLQVPRRRAIVVQQDLHARLHDVIRECGLAN